MYSFIFEDFFNMDHFYTSLLNLPLYCLCFMGFCFLAARHVGFPSPPTRDRTHIPALEGKALNTGHGLILDVTDTMQRFCQMWGLKKSLGMVTHFADPDTWPVYVYSNENLGKLWLIKKELCQNEQRAKEVPCPLETSSSLLELFTNFLQVVPWPT